MKSNIFRISGLISAVAMAFVFVGCNQPAGSEAAKESENKPEVVEVEEEQTSHAWVVKEHHVNNIPVTSKGKKGAGSAEDEDPSEGDPMKARERSTLDRQAEIDDHYEITTHEELRTSLSESNYIAMNEITITETVIPLGETHTVVSYSGKGKVKDTLQVVADQNGEVQHIVFTHKHHKDEYDVENGMTAKEVKTLRKDMKHMVKHGKVFLYTEDSNIMYVLEASNASGDEVVETHIDHVENEEDIDDMTVQAIVWKDKKHHSSGNW